ncbi:alpha/beta fold hydrolase [Streptomyces acidicola]|uniref:Alpha/beta fold hydrolase n=1 Tax=Streptomyces acidicola TaxID=2596892 RepID=A0A5N8X535_9ACTN|nr:alpha/beta fold hydrolase [Streptomyces acidicola]MPY54621.1 alpha/beta fold hydrolase [Streptomyces acidicola]
MLSDSIVFGAGGFIGRSLVAELLRGGHRVAAAVRDSGDGLTSWLDGEGVDRAGLTVVRADVTLPGLGLSGQGLAGQGSAGEGLSGVRDVYNTAARFAFGIDADQARAVNVTGAVHVVEWAASLPELRRVVHISGYRMAAADGTPDYGRLGAYEASKQEADAAVRTRCRELGVPLSIANPSTVIGPGQYVGLATVVSDLWRGRLRALPGGPEILLPVVALDYFVRFLAALPEHPESAGRAYWVLDEATPTLPELIRLLARHMGVRAPHRSVPVGVLRRLPRTITRADPETLSFLSTDRYDTASTRALAESRGLSAPPVETALRQWADDLVATRFGRTVPCRRPYGFHSVAGTRTWVIGERRRPDYVFLHGLPLNADSWAGTVERLDAPSLAADLPGFGRSGTGEGSLDEWLADLLHPVESRPVLVAHSLACGPALRYAAARPDRLSALVLVAPPFLQPPSPGLLRSPLAAPLLRTTPAPRLARSLGLPEDDALDGLVTDLRRAGAAHRVIAAVRTAHGQREELRRLLRDLPSPVELVVGSADPLAEAVASPVTVIEAAGHYPQITHPAALGDCLASCRDRVGAP